MTILLLFFLGLCFGSFINALVWRLHEQSLSKGKQKDKKLSIAQGRSMCPRCGHELATKDLLPVFSWLLLKGKCRYCHKPISRQYPLVELITAVLFVVSYIFWPGDKAPFADLQMSVNFVVWLSVLTGLVALCIYDLRWMMLPNRIVYPLLFMVSGLAVANIIWSGEASAFYDALYGALVGGGLFLLLFQVSAGKWIGGGDVKLGFLSGLLLADPYIAFLMLLSASTLGTVTVLPALMSKRLKATSRIPFGPFLIVATIFAKLFGVAIVDWYKRSLGL